MALGFAFLLAVAVILVVAIAGIYNRFIKFRAMMKEASSGMDVQLKRRHDLIPNIVESVKGYAQHEKKLFEEIAAMRAKLVGHPSDKEKGSLENGLSQALKSIFALAEAYPELKANQNFLDLQKNLSEIEEQIQMSRRYYNGTVRNYNIMVESFPSNLIGQIFGFYKADFFEITLATERATPEVRF